MVNPPQQKLPSSVRLALDFAPLAAFFLGYRLDGLMTATAVLIAVTFVSLAVIYYYERRISPAPLISGMLVAVLGGLTLALNNEHFIKIKPTLVNLLFAGVLLGGVYGFKKGLLRYVLDMAFALTDEGWRVMSRNWGFFFVALAVLNEAIWRNFSTDFWVDFKVFGMFTLTMLFAVSQMRLIGKYSNSRSE